MKKAIVKHGRRYPLHRTATNWKSTTGKKVAPTHLGFIGSLTQLGKYYVVLEFSFVVHEARLFHEALGKALSFLIVLGKVAGAQLLSGLRSDTSLLHTGRGMFICSLTLLGGDLKSWCSCYSVKLIYLGQVALLERLTKKQRKKLGGTYASWDGSNKSKDNKNFHVDDGVGGGCKTNSCCRSFVAIEF